jgi:hypothetical protein
VEETEILRLKAMKLERLLAEQSERDLLPHLHSHKFYWWMKQFFDDDRSKIMCVTAANQLGKHNLYDELIPTTNGYKKIQDINVGDYVYSRDGKKTKVIDIPFDGYDESYELQFSDGDKVKIGQNHLWICKGEKQRFRKNYISNNKEKTIIPNKEYGKWIVKSTKEIFEESYKNGKPRAGKKYVIPYCEPVEYLEKELFDPYYIGLYLGNGSDHSISFNSEDTDLSNYCLKYGNRYNTDKLTIGILKEAKEKLFDLGLYKKISHEKFIPKEYLFGSIEQRKAILAGLLDTDAYTNNGITEYTTVSEQLANDFKELVNSLGGIAQIKVKEKPFYRNENGEKVFCKKAYRINIWTKFNPFKSKRKSDLWKSTDRYKFEKVIDNIKYIGPHKGRCISVSADDESYLCTKNYIVTHNSSILIRKMIHVATTKELWPKYWPDLPKHNPVPSQFWYCYPSKDVATIEWYEKWSEYMPRNPDHEKYGWKPNFVNGKIHSVDFNSGVTIYFKTYAQDVHMLQSGTVYMMGLDEEVPVELLPELSMRVNATNGYMYFVFTATRGQEYWRNVVEKKSELKEARVWQVSLYDCQEYTDGSESKWTNQRIEQAIARCANKSEIERRIMGKFVVDSNRVYPSFDREIHLIEPFSVPAEWSRVVGIDVGSGGESGHPAAIVFLAINPDYTFGVVYKCWRGDRVVTTAQDVVNKYLYMADGEPRHTVYYDWASADTKNIAAAQGLPFLKAEKNHMKGEGILNSLLSFKMLKIFKSENATKLAEEFENFTHNTDKKKAKNDLIDALRYASSTIMWDFTSVSPIAVNTVVDQRPPKEMSEREKFARGLAENHEELLNVDEELNFWNEQY